MKETLLLILTSIMVVLFLIVVIIYILGLAHDRCVKKKENFVCKINFWNGKPIENIDIKQLKVRECDICKERPALYKLRIENKLGVHHIKVCKDCYEKMLKIKNEKDD